MSPAHCKAAADAIWDYAEIDRTEPKSWYSTKHSFWMPLYQHPAFKANREAIRIQKAFAQIWGTNELSSSVDRASLNLPVKEDWQQSGPSKLHWDTSLVSPVYFGVQGILYLTDTSAEQGAFRCVPGFHKRIEHWLANLPREANPRDEDLEKLGPVSIPIET